MEGLNAVLYGLMASVMWGSANFSGGAATKRLNAVAVVALSHCIGLVLLIVLAFASQEPIPPASDWLWGAVSGLVGAVGLATLYRGLAIGRAGVVAPISAVVAALLPVGWSIIVVGTPSSLAMTGIALGLVSVPLVSGTQFARGDRASIDLAVLSGAAFGAFYILIGQFSSGAVFYPLIAARATSASVALILVALTRQSLLITDRSAWLALVIAGGIDIIGTVFYALATQTGRLDEAVIVASLYPAVTILLAYLIRQEKISALQGVGMVLGIIAVACIGVG